jgi:hypothetical protein
MNVVPLCRNLTIVWGTLRVCVETRRGALPLFLASLLLLLLPQLNDLLLLTQPL